MIKLMVNVLLGYLRIPLQQSYYSGTCYPDSWLIKLPTLSTALRTLIILELQLLQNFIATDKAAAS